MKRVAEKQLAKDDHEDGHQEDGSESLAGEMQRADEATLATRRIRPLPKSRAAAPSPSSTNGTTLTTTEAQPPAPKVSFGGFSGFGATSNSTQFTFTPTPTPPNPNLGSAPAQSNPFSFGIPSTTPAAKPFSVPSLAPTASNTAKTFVSVLSTPTFTSSADSKPAPTSALNSPNQAEENDQVTYYSSLRGLNLSFLSAVSKAVDEDPFTDVGNLLQKYQSLRLDVQKGFDKRVNGGKTNLPQSSSSSSSVTSKPLAMPTPPASLFSAFSQPKPASKESKESVDDSDKASLPLPSLPFAFTSAPAVPKAPLLFGSTPQSSSGFSFAKPASIPAANDLKPAFGGFGGFGSPATTASGIGSSVGFSFASSSAPASVPPSSTGGFSFGKPAVVRRDTDQEEDGGESSGTDAQGSSQESEPAPAANLDGEGEGEEQEDTVHAVKVKAYRLKSTEENGGPGWIEQGVGMLRLKKHKETHKRRVLLRNSSTGKINLNFNLYGDMKPSHTKKTVTFIGHDGEKSRTYSLRLPTEDDAKTLKEILEKEIALVKAKADA
ncbi:hypothetical protein BDN72DRAFT_820948 [Pluteus cervinus]|uniref:Uncharacterized protein n=1 Tax=Pluteus cervinus TaxID=181527 RepID=A0ACD3ASK1_9AGAR|nr:hypothetical protein BDN72DRAFT_820948 [Pluteus cervinus]